ncbi:MAG TPA: hypothetical protein PLV21_17900 [Cyclobacteriaceae bacterium]|nr:hypothetical protein [Cyclobacteriaceae bacterium]HRJ83765.1 hypothetical protein [Cyclobacteriaceae bacterium]
MKPWYILLLIALSTPALSQANESKPKSDSVHRADSIARWKADSTRIANSSPLRMNAKQNSHKIETGSIPAEKKVKSEYTYDKDGRVTGGNTSLQLNKSKKRKD